MHDPLFALAAPACRTHRSEHDELGVGGAEDPAQQDVGFLCPLGEVRCQVHSGGPTHLEEAFELDPDQLPDRAATVAAEDVAGLDLIGALVRQVGDRGDNAAVDLFEPGQLVEEADAARCELLGPRLHQRLEADLGQVGRELGAGGDPVGVFSSRAPGLLCEQDAAG